MFKWAKKFKWAKINGSNAPKNSLNEQNYSSNEQKITS